MKNYGIIIEQTRSLATLIEAESPQQALIVALNELIDNLSNMSPEDFSRSEFTITCEDDGNKYFLKTDAIK
jgi:hypothetical protein